MQEEKKIVINDYTGTDHDLLNKIFNFPQMTKKSVKKIIQVLTVCCKNLIVVLSQLCLFKFCKNK